MSRHRFLVALTVLLAVSSLARSQDPEPVEPVLLATALYDDGQLEAAETLLREAVKAKPEFTIGRWAKKQSFSNSDDLAHMLHVLEELGVPK